jgi:WD40 repeat protein
MAGSVSCIFLSHSSQDNFEAVALRDWLASEGWDDVFLDLDPERGIAAGERWERALHEAATRCEAVVFLVSMDWLASGWCLKEYTLARTLNKKLFGVVIDPGRAIVDLPPELKGTWQVVNIAGGQDGLLLKTKLPGSYEERHVVFSKEGLRRLRYGLEKAGLDPKFFVWPPENDRDRVPYRGLKPLESVDAGIFFGRDAPIVEATDKLRGLTAAAAPRLLVILGASGAGKSSFLRAGLLPRLTRDDRNFLALPVIRPDQAALTADSGLLGALGAALPNRTRAEIRTAILAGAAGVRPLLAELVTAQLKGMVATDDQGKPPTVVLAIDQAEELFRFRGAEESVALLDLIKDLTIEDAPPVIAVFAIRSDSYDLLEHARPLEGLAQNTLPLLPMPRGAYKDVIEGPARRYTAAGGALTIEPQLTERLLDDLDKGGGSDSLPLLAFTLEQLFLDYRRSGALRVTNYEDFGGLKGAIDAAIERAFARADSDSRIPRDRKAREAVLRRGLIPWLAGIDPDSKSPRRNVARRSDIPDEARPLIDLLVEERLLTTSIQTTKDPSTNAESRIVTIEPAHEALLRQWGMLQGWLTEDFGLLVTLEGVKRAARDWDANARLDAWLVHQGQRLAEARSLGDRPDIAASLDAVDRAYLAGCRAEEETTLADAESHRREREDAQARRLADARKIAWRTGIGLVVALVLAVAALAGALVAFQRTGEAQAQRDAANGAREDAQSQRDAASAASREAEKQRDAAETSKRDAVAREADARRNQAAALTALSSVATEINPTRAVKLALAAWPRSSEGQKPKLAVTMTALSAAVVQAHEREIFRGHDGAVYSAVFSPDGTRVISASDDRTARLWDAATGKQIAILRGHEGRVVRAAFSPDGTRVVTASLDKTARLWNAATGKQVALLGEHANTVGSAVFSPDGTRIISASDDGTARLWDAATGKQIAFLRGHDDAIQSVAFSPDGTRVVTASEDNTARLWDATTGKQIAILRGHGEAVNSAAFSPGGTRIVTASSDNTARLWDTATGKAIVVLRGHNAPIGSAVFSPDGSRVVTASDDQTARLWDAVTGASIAILRGHDGGVNSAAFSPDGTLVVTTSEDQTARLWDAATGRPVAALRGHGNVVYSAAFSPNGTRIVTASGDKTVRLWDVAMGKPMAVLRGHDGEVFNAAFSPDGSRVVTASDDQTARLWDAATGKPIAVLRGHDGQVFNASFSPDGSRIVTASWDKTARLWDGATGKEIGVLRGHSVVIRSVAFSPDGTRVVTASLDDTARVWDVATGKEIAVLGGHSNSVVGAAFSPDGTRVVTASEDNTARLWDAATGKPIAVLRGHGDKVNSAAFSPDGTRVVTASDDKTARLWDATTGASIAILRDHDDVVNSAAFSPDGTRVVTASGDKTVRLWDVAMGKPIAVLRGHDGSVESATFSPDGTRIVTASWDETARLWDAATGQEITILRGHNGPISSAAFSLDGTRVVTASKDTTARVWDIGAIPKGDIFRIACVWLPDHDLTDVASEYGLSNLDPICGGDPPLPEWSGR